MASKVVVVTGTSTGIGLATVKTLAQAGYTVFGTVRKTADGEQFADLPNATPLLMDVTDYDSIQAAAELVRAKLPPDVGMVGLVNNAGIAVSGPLQYVPLEAVRTQFEVNVLGLLAVTQAFLPLLQNGTSPGRIINISSIAGRVTSPFLGVYSASKYAVEALSDALRRELMPFRVKVVIVEPGPIATPIWRKDTAGTINRYSETPYGPLVKRIGRYFVKQGATGLPAATVGNLILSILQNPNPKTRYLITPDKLSFWLGRLMPDKWLDRMVFKQLGMADLTASGAGKR